MKRKKKTTATSRSSPHEHVCVTCSWKWKCIFSSLPCQVSKAVKVNKSGPFCELCRYEKMARRIRALRLRQVENREILTTVRLPLAKAIKKIGARRAKAR